MKRLVKALTVVIGAAALVALARGGAEGQMSHEGHGAMSHEAQAAAAAPQGVLIREAQVEGYALAYRLYSWAERNVMMKGMEGHEMAGMDNSGKSTNHLMVFIKDAGGKEVSGAKVGFVVTAPDRGEQKTLTMAMSGGYGADVALKAKGDYSVKLKAVIGAKTLTEEFTHTVR